jgi:hypothetical protein
MQDIGKNVGNQPQSKCEFIGPADFRLKSRKNQSALNPSTDFQGQ